MFVIKSDQLKKNLNIEDEDIIGDPKTLRVGHEVQFFYKEKVRKGCIIEYVEPKIKRTKKLKRSYSPSDYDKSESTKSKKKCDSEKKSKISAKVVNTSISESSDNDDDDKTKQVDNTSEVSLSEDSVDEKRNGKESDATKNISPKNDCPSNEIKHEEKKDSNPNDKSASQSGVQHRGLDNDDHLFGENSDNMILLREGIYVKKIILDTALRTASQGSHLARQLLEGVIKPEYLRRCTITGNASRGKKDPNVLPIHAAAKNAIIVYAQETARAKNWTFQEYKVIERSMGQKLTEIKGGFKRTQQLRNT